MFRLRYWIVRAWFSGERIMASKAMAIVMARTARGASKNAYSLTDGPFDTREEAVAALEYWGSLKET